MTTKEQFDRGTGDWEKLFGFMDENNFTRLDFLACVCAHLLHEQEKEFKIELMLKDVKFEIEIRKDR